MPRSLLVSAEIILQNVSKFSAEDQKRLVGIAEELRGIGARRLVEDGLSPDLTPAMTATIASVKTIFAAYDPENEG